MAKKFKLTRDVTSDECSWLDKDLKKDQEVFEYTGHTYGCIAPTGIACTDEPDRTPFFEVPADALEEVTL